LDMNDLSCSQCGGRNPANAHFCFKCGAELTRPALDGGRETQIPQPPSRAKSKAVPSYRAQFWLLTIAGMLFVLLLTGGSVWFVTSLNPDIIDIEDDLKAIKISKTAQFTYSERVTDRELQKLLPVAEHYTNPKNREESTEAITPDLLLSNPSKYDGRTVIVYGELSRRAVVQNLLENDWPQAYILGIWANGKEVSVIYRGYVDHLNPGDIVQVEGVFVADGKGINADRVTRLEVDPQEQQHESLWLLRASIAVFLWLIFCTSMFLWRAFRRNWFRNHLVSTITLFIGVSILMAGCTMDITTVINPDGSGLVTSSFTRAKEDIDFLREMPGMTEYMDAWISNLRQDGMFVENWIEGENETFFMQRTYGNLDDLSETQSSEEPASWLYATKYTEDNFIVFRFMALVDTTAFYQVAEGLSSSAAEEIRKELDQAEMKYSLVLPGEIVYHNSTEVRGNRISWMLRMNDHNEIVAESRLPLPVAENPMTSSAERVKQILLIIVIVSTVLLIISLLGYRLPKEQRK